MSVDLPEPDGPTMATNSPRSRLKLTPAERVDVDIARMVGAGDVLHVDHDVWHTASRVSSEAGLRRGWRGGGASFGR